MGLQECVDVGNTRRTKRSHPRRQRSAEPTQLLVPTCNGRRRKALLRTHILCEGAPFGRELEWSLRFRDQRTEAPQPPFSGRKKKLDCVCGWWTCRGFESGLLKHAP